MLTRNLSFAGLFMAAAFGTHAATETLNYSGMVCCQGGWADNDPPPPGFLDFFRNNGPISASFTFERNESVPAGPHPTQPPLRYDYHNLTNITVTFGQLAYEVNYASGALGLAIVYQYPGHESQTSGGGLAAVSGPTVMGLAPVALSFESGLIPGAGSPDVFPSASALAATEIGFFVSFRTPAGGIVNVGANNVAPIPEPGSHALFLAGLAALALMRFAPDSRRPKLKA